MATLLFIGGGPWDDKMLDSRVEDPPARIGPTPRHCGVYERVGSGNSDVFLYLWRPDERLTVSGCLDVTLDPGEGAPVARP
jgi:hypothetical protein